MKTAFLTGGSGFIGGHLIRQLVAKGYSVRALARSESSAHKVTALGAQPILGDLEDEAALRSAMTGCDVVFHLAAWYELTRRNAEQAYAINVDGTRRVLRIAHEVGVPRIVYTSTVATFGDTGGNLVDETYHYRPQTDLMVGACQPTQTRQPANALRTEYDRTKYLAHEAALELVRAGAPIITVMPGGVYGAGDTSSIGEMMTLYLRGFLALLPGPETMLTYAHVEDVAAGHILAAEQGKVGESYILAGPALTMEEVVALWAELTGKPRPLLGIPARFLRPFAPLMDVLQEKLPLPNALSGEALRILGATYIARSDKAMQALGWQPRPLADGMRATLQAFQAELDAQAPRDTAQPLTPVEKKQAGLWLLGAAAVFGLLLVILLRRRE
ncbi:MAG: NAD-dependent epimerase/dehydratase family protein [Anaerolineales bacterium]